MTPSADRVVATALVAVLVLAGAGSAAAVPTGASAPGSAADAIPDDPTGEDGNETDAGGTVDETVEDAENATDETTDSTTETVEDTTNETEDTVEDTTNETEDTVEDTTNETEDTVDETEDTVDETEETVEDTESTTHETAESVENTTESIENTTDGVTDTTEPVQNTTDAIRDAATGTVLGAGASGRLSAGLRVTDGPDDTINLDLDSGAAASADRADGPDADGTATGDDERGDTEPPTERDGASGTDSEASTNGGGSRTETAVDGAGPLPPSPGSVGPGSAAGAVAVGGAALALVGRRYGVSPASATGIRAGAGSARALGRYALERLREYGWRLLGLLGYERYAGDPLDHDLRATIHEEIRVDPGIHLSAVAEAADAPLGTVRHHLRRLEAEGLIDSEKSDGRRRYVPAGTEPDALANALRDDAPRAVLEALFEDGPASTTELADRIDRDPSTATHHAERLADAGLIERERDGRAVESRLCEETRAALARRRGGVDAGIEERTGGRSAATTD